MNTTNLKKYAPLARKAFINAVSRKLNELGIYDANTIATPQQEGGVLLIEGRTFSPSIKAPRERLVRRIQQMGFMPLQEQVAYTWFNRFCAIRYMEIHDYLGHGFRVLSHPTKASYFEVLDFATDAASELGLDVNHITELKLAGNQDEALYRELLLGQCHKLHEAMPFLFDALDDEAELLLPDNLTRSDSILRALVDSIPEEDWQQVEVIGWLYQFYISEKKDQVMGKVVKSEDIPAATQLFTPNWIVKYLVENSVGRQWLQTYPESAIKSQMDYYIEPAEQSPEVIEQLKAITPESIEPESIKVLDPACGSGHILVEAYNVLKAIYKDRDYKSREIPKLILENNLYGLDIDDRAAQLAGFSLMMMARADDRRIFTRNVRLNVLSLQETKHLDLPSLWQALNLAGDWQTGTSQSLFAEEQPSLASGDNRYQLLLRNVERFQQAKTFGSLIDVPSDEHEQLKELFSKLVELQESGDSMQKPAAKHLSVFVHQALVLSIRYDAVIANPPYMGSKGMNSKLKEFAKKHCPNSKADLFAIFMERAFKLLSKDGFNAQINMQSWMFLSSYEQLRSNVLEDHTFITMAHLGARAFGQISGQVVQTTAWIIHKKHIKKYHPTFYRLIDGIEEEKKKSLLNRENEFSASAQVDFKKIPGRPIAYWVSEKIRKAFENGMAVAANAELKAGMSTGDNTVFQRYWYEVNIRRIDFNRIDGGYEGNGKWFPCNSGGEYRKWYGNNEVVVDWENNGERIKAHKSSAVRNESYYFREGLTYSKISSGKFAVRLRESGFAFDDTGRSIFTSCDEDKYYMSALLCSVLSDEFLKIMAPSLSFTSNEIGNIPTSRNVNYNRAIELSRNAISIAKSIWNAYESSWGFRCNPLIRKDKNYLVSNAYKTWNNQNIIAIHDMQKIEEENNRIFIEAFGLQSELTAEVPLGDVTLTVNPKYRYGGNANEQALAKRFQSDTLSEFISYSVGCIFGRYSLDQQGLIYANKANEDFDNGAYKTFPADEDGIIPLTDQEWFKDDATNRFREFVQVVWGEEHLQENLDFVAESLCLNAIKPLSKKGQSESALETIRRYLSTQFYKDHLKTYKKRPIYWLFSSGKQKAFECLVYLHRYNEGTLSRMRTEYVMPLLSKYDAYAEQLQQQFDNAESTAVANRAKKELAALVKKQVELREFDDKLKHYADMRISLDLDDGVKVNYGKFGDLLAEVKAVTGKKPN